MKALRVLLVLFLVMLVQLISVYICFAFPSRDFYPEGNDYFDDWQVCRTRGYGEDGFFILTATEIPEGFLFELGEPLIAFESLGEYADIAYHWGEEFTEKYTDRYQRAEKIFYFVRDRVQYVSDFDQFGLEEFAQNADELATTIQRDGQAFGDCEDMAILLAVMYQGAGYRSAIAYMQDGFGEEALGHAAPFVYLPGYVKAVSWTINGEEGWVWAEATGSTNTFGWFPEDFYSQCATDGLLLVKEVQYIPGYITRSEPPDGEPPPEPTVVGGGPDPLIMILPFLIVVGLMGGILLLRRRH